MALERFVWIMGPLILLASCSPTPKSVPVAATAADPTEVAKVAVQKTPSFESMTALGLTLAAQGKHEEALKAFQRTVSISPRSPLAFNNICSQFNELKRWRPAIENCQKAVELEPGYVLAQNNLAHAWKQKTLQDVKIANLDKYIKEGKTPDHDRIDLGMELYLQGEYERAVETWTQVPEKSEYFAVAQNDMASAYILTKKFDQAKSCLSRALERDPKNALFLNNLKWLQSAAQEPAS